MIMMIDNTGRETIFIGSKCVDLYLSLYFNIFFIDNIMPMITLLIMIMIILKTLRFVPLHSAEASPETWTLKIQRPELSDAGEYECQVDAMNTMIVLNSST